MAVVWSCGVTGLRCVPQSRRFLLTLNTHGRKGSGGEKTAGVNMTVGDGFVRKQPASMLNTVRADLLLLFKEFH